MHALSIRENWVGLESNPEVLTEYAHKMGVSKCARAIRHMRHAWRAPGWSKD